jgi:hypothetical protein
MSTWVAIAIVGAAVCLLAICEAGYRLWRKTRGHPDDFEQQQ